MIVMMMIVIMIDDSYDVDDINYDEIDRDNIFNVNDENTSTKGVIYYLSYNDAAQHY